MQRAVKDNGAKSFMEFFEGSQPVNPDALPSVTVTRDGVALTTPDVQPEARFGKGLYAAILTTEHTDTLGFLEITWTAQIDGVDVVKKSVLEVVGSRYFEIGELRRLPGLGDTKTHSDVALMAALGEAEATVEDYTKYSFTERAAVDVFDACDFSYKFGIHVRRRPVVSLTSVVVDGEALDMAEWSVNREGQVRFADSYATGYSYSGALTSSYGVDNLVISYVYGDALEPDLKKAAIKLARHYALQDTSTIPDRARLMQTEFGLFVLDNPGHNKATGLHEVDAVLNRYCEVSPGSFA